MVIQGNSDDSQHSYQNFVRFSLANRRYGGGYKTFLVEADTLNTSLKGRYSSFTYRQCQYFPLGKWVYQGMKKVTFPACQA
jgi:hypothetical protein